MPQSAGPGPSRRKALALLAAGLAGCGGGSGGDSAGSSGSGGGGDSQYGGLRVSGEHIVDLHGNRVTLRGMNWGRWGTAQAQDAAQNAAQGANCVRIPLRWWGLYLGNGIDSRDPAATSTAQIDPGHLAILDQMIAWADQAGLWIVLFVDSNCGQDGTQPGEPGYCDAAGQYPNGNNFWSDAAQRAQFIAVWRFVADRYKSVAHLGLIEPLPEPNPIGFAASDITDFYTEVMSAIRAVVPGVPFLLGPRLYQLKQVQAAYDASWTDVVYTGDFFAQLGGTQAANLADLGARIQYLVDLRTQHGVPIFVQQVGVRSGDDPTLVYLNTQLTLLTTNDIGFTWWLYRDNEQTDSFGVLYLDASGNWITKNAVLAAIESYFKA